MGRSFDQIRHFGPSNPGNVHKLLEVFTRLESLMPPSRRDVLHAQAAAAFQDRPRANRERGLNARLHG